MSTFLIILFICIILFPIGLYFIQKSNLHYYKLNGRYNIEIECWLKKQSWFNSFKSNIEKYLIDCYKDENGNLTGEDYKLIDKESEELITGLHDKTTISDAFAWMDTPEGSNYWGNIEYKFLKWYFGQYVDFHLFK